MARLIFLAGKSQTILEQNAKDIDDIKDNHLSSISTRLGKLETGVALVVGQLAGCPRVLRSKGIDAPDCGVR